MARTSKSHYEKILAAIGAAQKKHPGSWMMLDSGTGKIVCRSVSADGLVEASMGKLTALPIIVSPVKMPALNRRQRIIVKVASTATGLSPTELWHRGDFAKFINESRKEKKGPQPSFRFGTVCLDVEFNKLMVRLDGRVNALGRLQHEFPTHCMHPSYIDFSYLIT
jgi:hypothetical protein